MQLSESAISPFILIPLSLMIMKSFHDLITERRTIRRYTTEPVDPDHVRLILEAALMAPTSKSSRSWRICVYRRP